MKIILLALFTFPLVIPFATNAQYCAYDSSIQQYSQDQDMMQQLEIQEHRQRQIDHFRQMQHLNNMLWSYDPEDEDNDVIDDND